MLNCDYYNLVIFSDYKINRKKWMFDWSERWRKYILTFGLILYI